MNLYGKPIENIDELLESNLPIKLISALSYLFSFSFGRRDNDVSAKLQVLPNISSTAEAGNMALRMNSFATLIDTGSNQYY